VASNYPATGSVIVHVVDPAGIADSGVLTATEREVAGRFRFEKDAVHWRACRTALRVILGRALDRAPGELVLETGEFGKPALAAPHGGLHFNLSHCRNLALVALCAEVPVGIDIEPADRGSSLLGCEASFCHPEEISGLPTDEDRRGAALLDLWTRKEALLKALGTGMSLAPETVSLADPSAPHPRLLPFGVRRLRHPLLERHVAHLAAPHACTTVEIAAFQG
jgi:4'-phosphopantetheinyl transferase